MAEEDQSSKTEEPSEKKIRDARQKGNVPITKEIGVGFSYISLLLLSSVLIPFLGPQFVTAMKDIFIRGAVTQVGEGLEGIGDAGAALNETIMMMVILLAPLFVIFVLMALASIFVQGQFVVSLERIKPKLEKVSPLAGFKRIFSMNNLVEFFKSIVKVSIVAIVAYLMARPLFDEVGSTEMINVAGILHVNDYVQKILWGIVIFVIPVALADLFWQRFSWRKKMRMSMKEVRDEHKDSEGNPQIKARVAELRRQRGRQRMMADVKTATVIITNPTHFAVALRYDGETMAAPVCVAKGVDKLALKIREIAGGAEVPIIESPPLARALYATTELEQTIPYDHWKAVAEIISFVNAVNSGKRAKPPEGAVLFEG